MDLSPTLLKRLVDLALEEDIGSGDITTDSVVPPGHRSEAYLVAKTGGVIAGLDLAALVLRTLDPDLAFTALVADGEEVARGAILATLSGSTRAILSGERVALNFLQRLSGIATATRRAVEAASRSSPRVAIVDTRKTTPGLRALEKYAVRCGGGRNHRFGLYDAILLKDNHIAVAGGIKPALEAARRAASPLVKIEVEVETIAQVEEALEAGAQLIMLDNMDEEQMREAVTRIGGRALIEASGGVTPERLGRIAATGVDLISMGALTHSVRAVDISLEIGRPPSVPR